MKYMRSGKRWVGPIRALAVAAVLVFTAAVQAQVDVPATWQSRLYSDHPLVGKIFNSRTSEFVPIDDLLVTVEGASYLLLGEKHDNPDHHHLQAAILNHLIARRAVSQVAFEMLDTDASNLLADIQQQQLSSLDELKNYLQWDEEGWDWSFYGPLVDAVYRGGISMAAANINSARMMQVYSEELPASIAGVLDASTMEQLNIDIDESHCGLLPESQFPAMVRVQQYRDFIMAASMNSTEHDKLSVLVAGNYHIRQDLGVPNYLRAQDLQPVDVAINSNIVSLSFMEVDPEIADAPEYLQQFGAIPAYDFIWFTPAISNEDYCASLR